MSQEILGRLDRIETSVATLNHEYAEIVKKTACIYTDVAWLKRFFWVVAGASISTVFMALIILVRLFAGG